MFRDRADEPRAGLEISHVGLRLEGKWTAVALVPSRPFCQRDHSATHRPVAATDNDDCQGSRPRSPAIPPLVSCMPVILFRHELLLTDEPSDERIEDIVDTACLPLLHATTST